MPQLRCSCVACSMRIEGGVANGRKLIEVSCEQYMNISKRLLSAREVA
jgi:hypothetical protein